MTHSAGRPSAAGNTRLRYPSGPGTATLAYLRRRRKKRKKAGVEAEGTMLALGTPAYGWEPGNVAGSMGGGWASGGGLTSRIYDQVVGTARDLVQLSIPQQPDALEDAGKRWARMAPGESMTASGLALPAVFTLKCVFRVAAGGVNATSDAIWTLDNGGGKSLSLQAGGSGSDFLGSIVGVGTDIPSIADFLASDVVDGGTQEIALEVDQTNDVMTVWANNQVRAVVAFTGTLDGTWSLQIGGSIEADWALTYIYDGTLNAAEHLSAATYAVGYGATLVAGEWASRFTAVPVLSGSAVVDAELTTDDGTTINARGAADSFTYAWRAETDGLQAGETANAYTIDAALEGDKVRSEVTNTVLGQAVTAVSAYTDTIVDEITPADISSAQVWYDLGDEATITGTAPPTQIDDKINSYDITSITGGCESGNATYDENGLNTLHIPLADYIQKTGITLSASPHFFIVGEVLNVNSDSAATLFTISCSGHSGNGRLASGSSSQMQGRVLSQVTNMFSQQFASAVDRGAFGLWELVFDAAADTLTVYYNGTQIIQRTDYGVPSNVDLSGTIQFWIGRHLGGLNNLELRLGEFVGCDAPVSGADLTNLRSYFYDRWDITP